MIRRLGRGMGKGNFVGVLFFHCVCSFSAWTDMLCFMSLSTRRPLLIWHLYCPFSGGSQKHYGTLVEE